MKKIVSLLIVIVLICGFAAVPAQAAGTKTYSDVPSNHWAAYYISRSTELGILFGFSDGKFYPDKTLTKAELAQILYNMSPEYQNGEKNFTLPRGVRDVSKKHGITRQRLGCTVKWKQMTTMALGTRVIRTILTTCNFGRTMACGGIMLLM